MVIVAWRDKENWKYVTEIECTIKKIVDNAQ